MILFLLFSAIALGADFVQHPAPKDPYYVPSSLYASVKEKLPRPPDKDSAEQRLDEQRLLTVQESRSKRDCKRAKAEVFVSLKNFFGAPYGELTPSAIEKLSLFFEQLRNDGDYFVQRLKKEYPRKRPFLYIKGLTPCVPKEVTDAFPSGHAVLSTLYALVLSDFFPKKKALFTERAEQISNDRVISGMHHPTDIDAGKKLGERLYEEFRKSEKYQAAFKEQKAKLGLE